MYTVEHLVGGKPVTSERRRSHRSFHRRASRRSDASGFDEVAAAVTAAHDAFPTSSTSLSRRSEILFAFRELLHKRQSEIAEVIGLEHGKVIEDAAGEVSRGLDNVDFACGLQSLLRGGFSRQVHRGVDVHETLEPLGVVVGITPFNFPVMVPLWMIPNALAWANSLFLKPSEKDPSASLLLARLLEERPSTGRPQRAPR